MDNADSKTQDAPGTNNEKGDQDLNISFALGEMTGSVNTLRADLKDFKTDIRQDINTLSGSTQRTTDALEARLSSVEKKVYMASGVVAFLVWAATQLVEYFKHG